MPEDQDHADPSHDGSQDSALPSSHEQAQGRRVRDMAGSADGDGPVPGAPARVEQEGPGAGLHASRLGERRTSPGDVDGVDADGSDYAEYQELTITGPIPVPQIFAGYENVLPGAADRILSMAEKAQQAQIDTDLVPIRAEAWALKVATFAVAFFPWVAITAAIALLLSGYDVAAYLAGLVGVLSVGPQIISATRRARAQPTTRSATTEGRRRKKSS